MPTPENMNGPANWETATVQVTTVLRSVSALRAGSRLTGLTL